MDEVITALNNVLRDMGGPKGKAANNTYLPAGALGKNFSEEEELRNSHAVMKDYIENEILGKIADLVDEFGKKTKKAKDHYEEAEHANTTTSSSANMGV
ncbi:hypothetical protein [Actinacidiphila soli]|uniref:hypothetical protein n=1 Tax=Actinacidiphila soli TaxID=2487275 RepID=UPI001F0BC30D|nr:hypothetical protein [Actinacidiphila soli]